MLGFVARAVLGLVPRVVLNALALVFDRFVQPLVMPVRADARGHA
jgi:hypothetical protein